MKTIELLDQKLQKRLPKGVTLLPGEYDTAVIELICELLDELRKDSHPPAPDLVGGKEFDELKSRVALLEDRRRTIR